jgi:hypothetical protein
MIVTCFIIQALGFGAAVVKKKKKGRVGENGCLLQIRECFDI